MFFYLRSKKILNWCLLDFGISSYPTLILTFFYGTFYVNYLAENTTLGASFWGFVISFSSIFCLLIFSFISLFGGKYISSIKSSVFRFFFYLMCFSSGILFFFDKGSSHILPLIIVSISFISFEIVNVFYNYGLHQVSSIKNRGIISNLAWSFGYFGGLLSLSIVLGFINIFGDTVSNKFSISPLLFVGPFVCVWSLFFGRMYFSTFPDEKLKIPNFLHLLENFKSENLGSFFWSYFFLNNAIICIFAFASIFASILFGLQETEILLLGIFINLFGIVGCLIFGKLDDTRGSRWVIKICLVSLLVLSFCLFFIEDLRIFWILALGIGLFVGPIQASSRSLLAKSVEYKNQISAFTVFSVFGNLCAILGPFLIGLIIDFTQSIRFGLLVIPVFFLISALILFRKS